MSNYLHLVHCIKCRQNSPRRSQNQRRSTGHWSSSAHVKVRQGNGNGGQREEKEEQIIGWYYSTYI